MFKRRKLTSIISSFDKILSDLDNLQVENTKEIEDHTKEISQRQKDLSDLAAESDTAGKIYANIQKLIAA